MSVNGTAFPPYADHALQKPAPSEKTTKQALEDTSWADGLRGISAIFVMSSHMVLAFARYIVRPADGSHGESQWLQKPILRLIGQGPAWVALFIILMGFVNALKPIKLARAGNVDTALSNMAVSSFKRTFRLFLPATAATVLSWFFCQLGAYETARNSDAYWLYITSPLPSETWPKAIADLLRAIRTTWEYNPDNPYDQPQWALMYLLQGSMYVFGALLISVNLRPRFRVIMFIFCYFWSFNWGIKLGDPMVGIDVFTGLLLVELNYSKYPLLLSPYSPYFVPPLTLAALVLMSFPSSFHEWTYWTNFLLKACNLIAPRNIEVSRYWPTIGAQLLSYTIVLSPHLRMALSHPWLLWLGKISFPIYLLHGSFMRSVLSWMLFQGQVLMEMQEDGGNQTTVMRYPLPGIPRFIVVMPIFLCILLAASHAWTLKIEPWFGRITDRAQKVMFASHERPAVLPTRKD